jgi:hypothetical protein
MQHHRIVTLAALKELLGLHGFTEVIPRGAGYYPFPAWVGNRNPGHAHFITVLGKKSARPTVS